MHGRSGRFALETATPQLAYGITTRSDDDRTADWRRRAGRGLRDHAELRAAPAAVRRCRSETGGTPPGRTRGYRRRAAHRAAAGRDRQQRDGVRRRRGGRVPGPPGETRPRPPDDPPPPPGPPPLPPAPPRGPGAPPVPRGR